MIRLPPGTLRRLRIKWFALGLLLGTGSMAALAMYAAVLMPPELAYRSPTRNVAPLPPAPLPVSPAVELPPCTGQGKDCTHIDEIRTARRLAPPRAMSPDAGRIRAVPAPGSISLVCLGIAVLVAVRKTRKSNQEDQS